MRRDDGEHADEDRPVRQAVRSGRGTWFAWLLVCAAVFLSAPAAFAAEPLVAWRQQVLKIDDPGRSLEVDAAGRVTVHVPAYMTGAGDFVFELDPEELGRLRADLALLEGLDLPSLRAARAGRLRQLAASGSVPARAGSALSHFDIAGIGTIGWRGLAFEAGWVGDPRLELLAALEARFTAWTLDARRRPPEAQ